MDAYQLRYWSLGTMDMKEIVKETGCNIPCKYTEYNLPSSMSIEKRKEMYVLKLIDFMLTQVFIRANLTGFRFILASNRVTKRIEVEMYPFSSFVSDVGGALGLFVGFSFMALWDAIEFLLILIFKYEDIKLDF